MGFRRTGQTEPLKCINHKTCGGTARNGLYCQPCDQAILAAVNRTNQQLRTSVNDPPR